MLEIEGGEYAVAGVVAAERAEGSGGGVLRDVSDASEDAGGGGVGDGDSFAAGVRTERRMRITVRVRSVMIFREWRRLVISRQILRRRFFGVPVFVAVCAAVLHTVAFERLAPFMRINREMVRLMDVPEHVDVHWTAEYDEREDVFRVARLSKDEWLRWMRVRYDALKIDQPVVWSLMLTTSQYPRFLGRELWVSMAPGQPPSELDRVRSRAVESIDAAYRQSERGRRFPGAVQDAANSADGNAKLYRLSPLLALWTLSVVIAWLAALGALVGVFVPRRPELAKLRRADSICVRCRYPMGDERVSLCPECGVAQV
jgi:hypothetical protein